MRENFALDSARAFPPCRPGGRLGSGRIRGSRPSATLVAELGDGGKEVTNVDDKTPDKGRAETVRLWIATIAAVVSALTPWILDIVRALRGW